MCQAGWKNRKMLYSEHCRQEKEEDYRVLNYILGDSIPFDFWRSAGVKRYFLPKNGGIMVCVAMADRPLPFECADR